RWLTKQINKRTAVVVQNPIQLMLVYPPSRKRTRPQVVQCSKKFFLISGSPLNPSILTKGYLAPHLTRKIPSRMAFMNQVSTSAVHGSSAEPNPGTVDD